MKITGQYPHRSDLRRDRTARIHILQEDDPTLINPLISFFALFVERSKSS